MQAWAAFGLLGPGATAAFPQFDKVGFSGAREGGGTGLAAAPRRREGAAPAQIQTHCCSLAPDPRPPPPQMPHREATPTSSADEADMVKKPCLKSPL